MMRRFRQFPTIGGRRGGIPADCVEVEYIWVNGNQYLDTGLTFSNAIEMFLKCKIENGRCGLISTTNHRYYAGVVSGKVAVGYNGTYNHAVCSVDDSIHTYGCTTSGFTIDGVTAVSYSLNAAEDNTTYYIGALNYKNTTLQYSVKGYIYSAKFVKSGTTILDLVPVRRVESGVSVGYMCDRLTGELYGNQGTGAFVVGPDRGGVQLVDYITSDGSAWIDTGFVVPSMDTQFEVKMACTPLWDYSGWGRVFFGAGSSSTSYQGPAWNFVNARNIGDIFCISPVIGNRRVVQSESGGLAITRAFYDGNLHSLRFTNSDFGGVKPIFGTWYLDGVAYTDRYATVSTTGTDALPSTSVAIFGSKVGTACVNKIATQNQFKFARLTFTDASDNVLADFKAACSGGVYGLYNAVTDEFIAGQDGTISGPA